MTKQITIVPGRTYASVENAVNAVEKRFPSSNPANAELRYIVAMTQDAERGHCEAIRYYPLFIGESAIFAGAHYQFNCVN